MFVLGIDPGLSRCGYGGIRSDGAGEVALAAGVITSAPEMGLPERLGTLQNELRELVKENPPDVMVVERVFFQTNVRTAMSVGQASGIALVVANEIQCPVVEYTSNEVKLAVTGYGSASKRQVQEMVMRLLRLAEMPHPPDAADALALALCHVASERVHSLVERAPAGRGVGRGAA